MNKKETFEVMQSVQAYYSNFTIEQKKIDLWHKVLQGHEFETVIDNLAYYVSSNKFQPSLSDLLEMEPLKGRGVKTAAETLEMIMEHEAARPKESIDPKTLPGWAELGEMLRKGAGR